MYVGTNMLKLSVSTQGLRGATNGILCRCVILCCKIKLCVFTLISFVSCEVFVKVVQVDLVASGGKHQVF